MFYKLIKVLPTAICGLALGVASLSNLLFNMTWHGLATVFFVLSCSILLLFIQKCILYPNTVRNELSDRNIGATFPTFPMALMTIIYIIKQNNIIYDINNLEYNVSCCIDLISKPGIDRPMSDSPNE